jgi:hypothetical protein
LGLRFGGGGRFGFGGLFFFNLFERLRGLLRSFGRRFGFFVFVGLLMFLC